MQPSDDHAIAQGLRHGNPEAWRQFYDAYAERVWRAAARLLGPHNADIADLVQETFLAAARSARGFDPSRGSLWAWVWGIARNHLALHFRKRDRQDRLHQSVMNHVATAGPPTPPTQASQLAETAELVRVVLAELPQEYEDVLTARYLDGTTVEQLADRDRCTETAVRSRLARARAAFRDAFSRRAEIPAGGSS